MTRFRRITNMARTADPNSKKFVSVGARPSDWQYLSLWGGGTTDTGMPVNPSFALEEALDRLRKMAPNGPNAGPVVKERKPPARRMPRKAVQVYAEANGLTVRDAIAELLTFALQSQSK